jgi:hypothetical protein
MRTVENLANSVGKLVCSEKPVGFDHLALAVNRLRFDGVQPRALLRKQATDDPYPLTALFDSAVVGTEPTPHLFGDVPRSVVPDVRTRTFLPTASSFRTLHSRKRVVIEETGLPSTNLIHVRSRAGR